MVIVGIILIALGIVLLIVRRNAQGRLLEIQATPTSPVQDILQSHRDVADELGSGGFSQLVEVKGTIGCGQPITAELSGEPCVYYSMSVEERYEETYQEEDSEGRVRTATRTGSNTVAGNSRSTRFHVDDGTGKIVVDPEGATIHPHQTLDRYEPAIGGPEISFGSFSFSPGMAHGGRQVLGYNYAESILPIGQRVYVIGEASDSDGDLVIRKPREKGKPFIVSLKSEEEIVGSHRSSTKWYMIGAIAAFAIGAVLMVLGMVSR
jgi:hypothetical protein